MPQNFVKIQSLSNDGDIINIIFMKLMLMKYIYIVSFTGQKKYLLLCHFHILMGPWEVISFIIYLFIIVYNAPFSKSSISYKIYKIQNISNILKI